MSDGFWASTWEYVNGHLSFKTLVTCAFLFCSAIQFGPQVYPFETLQNGFIDHDTSIAAVFSFCGLLLGLWLLQATWIWGKRQYQTFTGKRALKNIEVTFGQRKILELLTSQRPNPVKCFANHADIIALQQLGLVARPSGAIIWRGLASRHPSEFTISGEGVRFLELVKTNVQRDYSQNQIVQYLYEVTGSDLSFSERKLI